MPTDPNLLAKSAQTSTVSKNCATREQASELVDLDAQVRKKRCAISNRERLTGLLAYRPFFISRNNLEISDGSAGFTKW